MKVQVINFKQEKKSLRNHVYLSIGGNLNNPLKYINDSITLIVQQCSARILKQSKVYHSEPWGVQNQPTFLNLVICIDTPLEPIHLLCNLKQIERVLGRKKNITWGARKIDIDIISFNNLNINTSTLTIPHKHLCHRNFVLIPLKEVSPDFVHPVTKQHINTIMTMCEDTLEVTPLPD